MHDIVIAGAAFAGRVLPQPVKKALYMNRTVARFIRKELNRSVPKGFKEVTIAGGDNSGSRMILDLQSEKDYWLGMYEPELQSAVREFARPGFVAYDVGANIGYVTLLLAKAVGPGGRVVAFEVLPANLERLEKNVILNDLAGRVQIAKTAVVDETKPVEFLIGPSVGMGKVIGSSGREVESDQNRFLVPGIALDDFVYKQGNSAPDIVKIDIEGGETLALPGMIRILTDSHPVILLELHGPEAADVCWQIFSEANYRVCRMRSGYPSVISPEELDWKEYLVALPKA